ncbi:MAG: hypothetical protein IIC49_06990 [Planctomycetes bacterium]|nr:hypothetical protein [Planctomycetota bacterium]
MNSTHLPSNDSAIDALHLGTAAGTVVGTVAWRAVLAAAALGMAGIVGLAGCVAPANDRLTVNNTETLSTDVGVQESVTQYSPLMTIGRREWAPLTYTVPVDSVVHARTYAPTIEWTDTIARERGAYPTIESSLDTSASSRGQQRAEACAAPLVGLAQGFLVIPLLFVDRQTNADESPATAYQRAPVNAVLPAAISEAIPPAEDVIETGGGG